MVTRFVHSPYSFEGMVAVSGLLRRPVCAPRPPAPSPQEETRRNAPPVGKASEPSGCVSTLSVVPATFPAHPFPEAAPQNDIPRSLNPTTFPLGLPQRLPSSRASPGVVCGQTPLLFSTAADPPQLASAPAQAQPTLLMPSSIPGTTPSPPPAVVLLCWPGMLPVVVLGHTPHSASGPTGHSPSPRYPPLISHDPRENARPEESKTGCEAKVVPHGSPSPTEAGSGVPSEIAVAPARAAPRGLPCTPMCTHTVAWQRLRGKRGYYYFNCLHCGAKWKQSRRQG
eukprot:RCo022734